MTTKRTNRKIPYTRPYTVITSVIGSASVFLCLCIFISYLLIQTMGSIQEAFYLILGFSIFLGLFALFTFINISKESIRETYRKMFLQAPASATAKIVAFEEYRDSDNDPHYSLRIKFEATSLEQSVASVDLTFGIEWKLYEQLKGKESVEVRYSQLDPTILVFYPFEWSSGLESR